MLVALNLRQLFALNSSVDHKMLLLLAEVKVAAHLRLHEQAFTILQQVNSWNVFFEAHLIVARIHDQEWHVYIA